MLHFISNINIIYSIRVILSDQPRATHDRREAGHTWWLEYVYLALLLVLQQLSSSSGRSSDDTHHTLTAVVAQGDSACRTPSRWLFSDFDDVLFSHAYTHSANVPTGSLGTFLCGIRTTPTQAMKMKGAKGPGLAVGGKALGKNIFGGPSKKSGNSFQRHKDSKAAKLRVEQEAAAAVYADFVESFEVLPSPPGCPRLCVTVWLLLLGTDEPRPGGAELRAG